MLAQRARGGGAISRNPLIMSETAPRMFIKQEASLGDISTSQSEEPAGTVGGNNWVKTQAVGEGRLGHMPGNLCDKNESLTANNYLQVCGKKEYFSDRHLESNFSCPAICPVLRDYFNIYACTCILAQSRREHRYHSDVLAGGC